jgi:hypothetical protein
MSSEFYMIVQRSGSQLSEHLRRFRLSAVTRIRKVSPSFRLVSHIGFTLRCFFGATKCKLTMNQRFLRQNEVTNCEVAFIETSVCW